MSNIRVSKEGTPVGIVRDGDDFYLPGTDFSVRPRRHKTGKEGRSGYNVTVTLFQRFGDLFEGVMSLTFRSGKGADFTVSESGGGPLQTFHVTNDDPQNHP